MSANLESAFTVSQLAYPLLKASGDAVAIFNSSVAGGPTALGSGVLYAMTKVGGLLAGWGDAGGGGGGLVGCSRLWLHPGRTAVPSGLPRVTAPAAWGHLASFLAPPTAPL